MRPEDRWLTTTAGTGAEVTRNAVLASTEHRFKVSLRSAGMLPRLALVDPELTYSLPLELTASTGAVTRISPFSSKASRLGSASSCPRPRASSMVRSIRSSHSRLLATRRSCTGPGRAPYSWVALAKKQPPGKTRRLE